MSKPEIPVKKLTASNTKKEMLDAYADLVKQLQARRETEMKPEQKIEERAVKEATAAADSLSTEGIGKEIGNLKSEIGKVLVYLSDKLEAEIARYLQIKKAVELREKELQEICEIEKSASTLTALLELQQQKREKFEAEMAQEKEELESQVEASRQEWITERQTHEAEVKERDAAEKKRRDREAEDFKYRFEREQQLAREQFEYEKAKMEREIQFKKEEMEKDLSQREKALLEREPELLRLRERVEGLPGELEAAVGKAVKEATERLNLEAKAREEMLKSKLEGEKNVLTSRIEALQQTVKEQNQQIGKLSAQLEKSYGQVQDIAVKAIEGSSAMRSFAVTQPAAAEASRRAETG